MANEKYESVKRVIEDIEHSFYKADNERTLDETENNLYLRILKTLYKGRDKLKPVAKQRMPSNLEEKVVSEKRKNLRIYIAQGIVVASIIGGTYYAIKYPYKASSFVENSISAVKEKSSSLIFRTLKMIYSRE